MDGLIVNEPYASMIIAREKKWELRSRKPPEDKIKNKIGLLSQGKMLGTIEITDSTGPLTVSDLKKTISLHQSNVDELPKEFTSFAWKINVHKVFPKPKKYVHPMGARVWVKNIVLSKDYEKGKITHYIWLLNFW